MPSKEFNHSPDNQRPNGILYYYTSSQSCMEAGELRVIVYTVEYSYYMSNVAISNYVEITLNSAEYSRHKINPLFRYLENTIIFFCNCCCSNLIKNLPNVLPDFTPNDIFNVNVTQYT